MVSTAQCLALNVGGGLLQSAGDCIDFSRLEFTDDYFGCGMSLLGTSFGIAGCLLESVPIVGQAVGCGVGAISIARACFPASPALAGRPGRQGPVEGDSEVVWRVYELHLRIVEAYAGILQLLTGSGVWVEAVNVEAGGLLEQQRQVTGLLRQFVAFAAPNSSGGVPISPDELAAWKAAPRPAGFPAAAFDQMADYHNRTFALYQQGLITHAAAGRTDFQDRDQMRAAIRRLLDLFAALEALGATTFSLPDAHAAFMEELERRGTSAPLEHLDRLFFRLELLYTDVDLLGTPLVRTPQHGRMLGDGRLPFAALAPKALYLAEFFDPTRNLYGKVHFRTGPSGSVTQMPKVDLTGLDDHADTDGDGLPNLGEWVIGFLDPSNPDTDGEGGNDREDLLAALESGLPGPLSTGLVAAVDTDGEAADLAAHERFTVVADSGGGLVVVAVDGLNLTRVAVIPTPGLARAVAVDGDWAVGGDSRGVLTVLDLSQPVAELATPRARLSAGAPVWGVAVASPVAFVGLDSGQLQAVNLEAGVIVDRLPVSAQKVEDVVVLGGKVAALAAATVHLFEWDGASLRRMGHAPSVGNNTSPFGGRSRLFGDGSRVFATHRTGFNVFDATGPAPELLRRVETSQLHWKQIISPDGLRGVAAMGVNFGTRPVDDNVSLYDLGAPAGSDGFLTTLPTPGVTRAVLSRQGFIHAADHQAGLQVLNLNGPDRTGIAPAVTVRLDSGGTTTEPDRWVELVAEAADNIAVREVEFIVNDTRVYTDTSFPFRHRLRAPATAGESFVVTARAVDVAGNATLSSPLPVTVLPGTSPPRLLGTSPTSGQPVGALHEIVALFSERLDPTTVTSTSVVARAAGPDGVFDTGDDTLPSAATQTLRPAGDALVVSLAEPLPPGLYRLEISAALTDPAGHALTGLSAPVFRVAGPADMTDTDRDGLPDAWEIAVSGSDPLKADTNGNGIPDGDEDSDGDGLTTLFELFAGTDPTQADTFQTGRSDAELDADGDALTLLHEMFLGTDPTLPDTDGDGWNDEAEITLGSRPTDPRSLPWIFSIAPAPVGLARPAWDAGAGQYAVPQPVGLGRLAWESAADIHYGTSVGQPPLSLQRNAP
ncbi:MAG: Ig-like domain-containing protein [Verrucomicrobia bacterium]|nr:Ig-like domain-containing protein [Verrucomicrobiota bacterium]